MAERDQLDDRMDQRLRGYGAQWRRSLPDPAEPLPAGQAPRGPRWWLIPAAAAAVLAVVLGVTFAVTGGDREIDPAEPTETDDPVLVPWAPLPATDPDLRRAGRPTAEQIAAAPECRAEDLATFEEAEEGAAGTTYLTVQVGIATNAPDPEPCRLGGYPEVRLLENGNVLDVQIERDESRGPPEPVLVTPGRPAAVTVAWAYTHSCPEVDNDVIMIEIGRQRPGSDQVLQKIQGFGRTTCSPGEEANPPSARVSPILSTGAGRGARSPYEKVTVTGDLDLSANLGGTAAFEVTLTSAVDLPLDACPDYSILTGAGEVTYGLNCTEVPFTLTEGGTPFLPAGVPVRFAMRAEVPALDTVLRWTLRAPGRPTVRGHLDVTLPTGTLTGVVTVDGGPAPGTSEKITSGEVTAFGDAGTFTAPIAPDGSYEMELPAGGYELTVTSPDWRGLVCRDGYGVTGEAVNTADISCPIE